MDIDDIISKLSRLLEDAKKARRAESRHKPQHVNFDEGLLYSNPSHREGPSLSETRDIIRERRRREEVFGTDIFADPAWDIMLDLYAASLENADVSISSACIAAAVPPTTALRHLNRLENYGLIVRKCDPFDGRRSFIRLSDDAVAKMDLLMKARSGPRYSAARIRS